MRLTRFILPALFASFFCGTAGAADWLQWGYDQTHTGNNVDESTISVDNVSQLTRRYQVTISSNANVAPVFASSIGTPSGTKDLLFVTSQNGRLTAFDAADGSVVWSKDTAGVSPTESSPAIDPNREFVYSYGVDGKVHKYQIGDGTEITTGGWPEVATAKPSAEKGASAIAFGISGGTTYLYVVNNGYVGDGGDYQGHLTTINLATGAQTVFNSLCSDITIHMVLNGTPGTNDCVERQSGIWGAARRRLRSASRSPLHHDRKRSVRREYRRTQLGRQRARAPSRRHRHGRRIPPGQLHADDLRAARFAGRRPRLGVADDPQGTAGERLSTYRRRDRQGFAPAPDQPRRHERYRRAGQRRRRHRSH